MPINAIPITKKANTEVGVPFPRNNGIHNAKIKMLTVVQINHLRRPILSA